MAKAKKAAAKKQASPRKNGGRTKGKLTPQQAQFVVLYVQLGNASEAARQAKYSAKSAGRFAVELLSKPHIQAAIEERRRKLAAQADLTDKEIIRRLGMLATANLKDFLRWDADGVTLKPSDELTPEQAYCLQEVSEKSYRGEKVITFKLVDKVAPLRDLAKIAGLFVNKEVDPAEAVRELARMLGMDPHAMPEVEA